MKSEPVAFPSPKLPLCVACQRLRPAARGLWACAAFPGGIPRPLLDGSVDHREPYRGDRGIRFEPDWEAPDSVLARVVAGRGAVNGHLGGA